MKSYTSILLVTLLAAVNASVLSTTNIATVLAGATASPLIPSPSAPS
jgi:hypothetical protein